MNNISRREFIKVLSSAGTGLLVGFYIPSKNRLLGDAEYNSLNNFMPNGWVNITSDGRTIIYVSKSEMGQGVWTALPMIVADEMDLDWENVEIAQAETNPELYDSQGTGGSWAVRGLWKPLRVAASKAREMLVQAAMNKWKANRNDCYTENGFVIHKPSRKKLSYTDLAIDASKLKIPDKAPLKDSKDQHIIGESKIRKDSPGKVNGTAQFGIDKYLPGVVFCMVERIPYYGSSVESIDLKESRTISGFIAAFKIKRGVAIVGESTWAVMQARKKLKIKWRKGPGSDLSTEKINLLLKKQSKKKGVVDTKVGNPSMALKNTNQLLTSEYSVSYNSHSPMEPMNVVVDLRSDSCTIWNGTQSPGSVMEIAAEFTGLSPEKIKVHVPFLGGGFGRRLFHDYIEDALEIAKETKKPIKLLWNREDDMRHDFYRPASKHILKGGLDKNGNIEVFTHKVVAPSIEHSEKSNNEKLLDKGALEGVRNIIYTFPNFASEYKVANNPVPIGWWRSVYHSQNAFANESFMDEMAHEAGKDPVEFRLNYLKDSPRDASVLKMVAKKARWQKGLKKGHYQGVACHKSFATRVAEIAEISIENNDQIVVHKVTCAVDCGIVVNPSILKSQVESCIAYGLSAALKGQITLSNGQVEQSNFDTFEVLRFNQMPVVDVHIMKNDHDPTGVGEPPLPPVAPAIANALFAATGVRVRDLPLVIEGLI